MAPEIKTLLDISPPETAVPLPGTPWEVVPVQGRAPMAYVSAAASPNIEALSLYCEGGKPYMAMLLNKPSADNALTMTWNFSALLVNIPVQRANANDTQWNVCVKIGRAWCREKVCNSGEVSVGIVSLKKQ